MNNLKVISLVAFIAIMVSSCNNSDKKTESFDNYQRSLAPKTDSNFVNKYAIDVHAYYFHSNRRCATCEAVEAVTKQTIENNYNGKVYFEAINREEDKENPLIDKYKVNGQTLIVVNGDNVENITTDAFLNAHKKPEKFKEKLQSTIDSMLEM